jgi:SAM-dependent methyltransferase
MNPSTFSCLRIAATLLLLAIQAEATDAPGKSSPKKPDVPYVATPQAVVDKLLEMAAIQPSDVVYDLGCGDGRVVVTAAKRYGVKAIGFDIDPQRIKESLANVRDNKVEHLVSIQQKDIFKLDLREATVVFLYLLPSMNTRLRPQLAKLKPGSRIVSHDFDMGDAKPLQVVVLTTNGEEKDFGNNEHILYKWVVPWETEPPDNNNTPKRK